MRELRYYAFLFFLFFVSVLWAEIPQGYYNAAEGKSERELKTALHNIIRVHEYLNFNSSTQIWWYDYFRKTDWHPGGYFWDMYSDDKYDTYSGQRQNREHCMPRSWWGTSTTYASFDANGDLHNLYPSNYEANEAKSNYPLGTTLGATYDNGVVKVGNSTFSGYTGIVFEPADEYKGDFARTYLYMVTCYEDYYRNWRSLGTASMLTNNTYPTLTAYGINLLLKWHREDPVSQKELDRNEAVYGLQNNRNPFVDYPEFAEFIWGDLKGDTWYPNVTYTDFAVYPNPASTYIKVDVSMREGETVYYEIYAINGVRVALGTLSSNNTIPLTDIHNGLYILNVFSGSQRMTTRIIKAGNQD